MEKSCNVGLDEDDTLTKAVTEDVIFTWERGDFHSKILLVK